MAFHRSRLYRRRWVLCKPQFFKGGEVLLRISWRNRGKGVYLSCPGVETYLSFDSRRKTVPVIVDIIDIIDIAAAV